MKYRIGGILALVLLTAVSALAAGDYDSYGGWTKLKGTKTGFFHTQQINGRWWLVSPDGNAFFSKGVDNVSYSPENDSSPAAPTDTAAWAKQPAEQLRGWNFNTAGAWSARELDRAGIAYAPTISIASSVQRDVWLKGVVVDYFGQPFVDAAKNAAERLAAPRKNDPWLLGYFTDNELRWGSDWRAKDSLLEAYLKMEPSTPGFAKATEFLRARGRQPDALTDDDKSAFLEIVAAQYARVTSEAIRRADPNHMVLGCRFAGYPGDTVMRGVGPYFDVISFHSYAAAPPLDRLDMIYKITGKPTMITEFSFKASDSGLPNTKGAGRPVPTQKDRADGFTSYVQALAALPHCVGFHWFEYRDQPKEGRRLDGENSNFGVVTADFKPWEVLTRQMQKVNEGIEALHAAAK